MLPWPSIWPPPRKKASARPWAAQSNSSIPPLVKKLFACDPRIEMRTGGLPSRALRARSSIAPAAGIGDDAPTATWPMPSSRSAMVAIRISRRSLSDAIASRHQLAMRREGREIGAKPLVVARHGGIARDLGLVGRVFVPQRQRPGAACGDGDGVNVERRQDAGGRVLALQQIAFDDALDGDQRAPGGIGKIGELAMAADSDIAGAVGLRRVKQRHIGRDRG